MVLAVFSWFYCSAWAACVNRAKVNPAGCASLYCVFLCSPRHDQMSPVHRLKPCLAASNRALPRSQEPVGHRYRFLRQNTDWTGHVTQKDRNEAQSCPVLNELSLICFFLCVLCVQVAAQAGVYELLNQLGFSEFEDLRDSTLCRLRHRWQQQNRHGLPFRGEFIWETPVESTVLLVICRMSTCFWPIVEVWRTRS